jgi:hypothetical protein
MSTTLNYTTTPAPLFNVLKGVPNLSATTLKPGIQCCVLTVTQEMAVGMLLLSKSNRTLRRHRLNLYAAGHLKGQWDRFTGDAIKFDRHGNLIDGQHRLSMIVMTGKPLECLIIWGLDPEVFSVLDSGLPRQASDVLHVLKGTDVSEASVVLRSLLPLEAGLNIFDSTQRSLVTKTDIANAYIARKDEINEGVIAGRKVAGAIGGNRSAWALFYLLVAAKHPHDADEFVETIASGANLSEGDPRLALRNWLQRGDNQKNTEQRFYYLATYIKVFNSWRASKPVRILRPWTKESEWPTIR